MRMHCLIGVCLLSSAIAKYWRVCQVCYFHLATQSSGQTAHLYRFGIDTEIFCSASKLDENLHDLTKRFIRP